MIKQNIRRGLTRLSKKAYLKGKVLYESGRRGLKRAKGSPGQLPLFETKAEKRFEQFFKQGATRGEDFLLLSAGIGTGLVIDNSIDARRQRKLQQKYYRKYRR